ncbi:MAG: O-antigen ligase family protein, partial [Sphingomonadales bacterium]|nr:O-antigen ligase family protein [Sphingomonadales bacterium]
SFLILSNLVCTYFAGLPHHSEWQGFRVSLTILSTGWLLSRARYTLEETRNLYFLIIISSIPPLFFGFWELFVSHAKEQLELHSVGHVNHSAIYLVIIFGASFAWLLSTIKTKLKVIKYILLLVILLFFALTLSLSRAAVLVAIILAITLVLFSYHPKKVKFTGLSAIIFFVIIAFFSNSEIIQKHRHYQSNNNVMADRLQIWNVAIEMTRNYPLFGIGMFNWKQIKLEDLQKSVEKRNEKFEEKKYIYQYGHAHSAFFSALVEKGIIGLSVFIIFMLMWLRELAIKRNFSLNDKSHFLFWGGATSAWFSIFIIGIVNSTFNHENGILACLFLGLYLNFTRYINFKK